MADQLGFGAVNPQGIAPTPPTAWGLSDQRLKREQAATTGDYVGSIWRQDGLIDSLYEHVVGQMMAPDKTFNPFADPRIDEMRKGLWDEHKGVLFQAHSFEHAERLNRQLQRKQEDLVRLGDMGIAGNVGRFALNAIMPDQILMGMVGGRVAQVAKLAAGASKARAVAAGVATGAAENAAYEGIRQHYNFEDDTFQIAEAGLMGAAFTAPFALAGARAEKRVADLALQERDVMHALRQAEQGHELTPEQGKLIDKVHRTNEAVKAFEKGTLDEAGLEKALDEFHGPVQPDAVWLEQYSSRIKQQADDIISEHFSSKDTTRPLTVSPEMRSQMDARVAREDLGFASKALDQPGLVPSPTEANAANPQLVGQLQAKLKAALLDRAQRNDEARKVTDLAELEASKNATKRAELDAAWKQAEKDREAFLQADHERMVNARELARAAGTEDPFEEALKAAEKAQQAPAAPHVSPEPAEPAVDPLAAWKDRAVSWMNHSGEHQEGIVVGPSKIPGKVIVDTQRGAPVGMKSVAPEHLDQWEADQAPPGFLKGSIGSGQLARIDSVASQRTALTELTIPGTKIKVPSRLDIYSVLNGSQSMAVRELAYRLVKDPIQNDKFDAQGWTASEWKKQIQRTAAGAFHVESQAAFKGAVEAAKVPVWRRPGFAGEFYEAVTKLTRGDQSVLDANPEVAPHLQRAAAAQAKAYREVLEAAKKAGVKGAADVDFNDFYVNRVWKHSAIRDAMLNHGETSVVRVVAEAIADKAAVIERARKAPGWGDLTDAEVLMRKAKGFLGAVRALEYTPGLQDIHLAGRDMATLRDSLKNMGVPEGHIDDLVDLMFEVRPGDADAGQAGNLKFRFGLDETTHIETPAGRLALSDLFENDARVLVDVYTNSMAGHTGMAKVGITSAQDWSTRLREVHEEMKANPQFDGQRIAKDLALLEDVHRNITGRPMSTADFSATNRFAQAFRGYTRGVMLPQLGIASAFEMNKAIAMMGMRTLLQQLPSFRSMLVAIRQGYIPDEGLARDIMTITGFGQEKAASYMRANEIESGFFGQALTRAEAGANKVSHTVDVLSGNASFTSLTKQLSGMMAVQDMHGYAAGGKRLTSKLRERWVGQGISDDDIDVVLSGLKKYSDAQAGVVKQIRHEDWSREAPDSYEKFQLFVSRQVRDAIQDHDLGETMPFMHTTLGKVFSELKTFFLVAHAKNFLKNLHYRDITALQVWAIGFIGESLAYMTQSAVNYPSELDERLTPEKIASAAFFRMSAAGTASMLAESGYQLLSGGDSLVQPGMTANTDNRSFLNTPSFIVMKRLLNSTQTAAGLALGTDVTTKREARDLWGSIPGANLYGLKAAGQWWADQLPASDPDKTSR